MAFLPKDYKVPSTDENYLKLKEGTIKFRIVSDPILGYEYWTEENKPVRVKEYPQTKPDDIRLEEGQTSYTIKHFWAFKVIDRDQPNTVKILEITQSGIQRKLEALINDPDWSDPKDYDIKIVGTGDGLGRRYEVQPSPHKKLTAEEKSLVARTEINLEALYSGNNPFDKEVEIAPVEDDKEVKPSDVPFN